MPINVEQKENYTLLSSDARVLDSLLSKAIKDAINQIGGHIVLLLDKVLKVEDSAILESVHRDLAEKNRSFVTIVSKELMPNFSDDFAVVTTFQAALEYLETEEMQRKLGY